MDDNEQVYYADKLSQIKHLNKRKGLCSHSGRRRDETIEDPFSRENWDTQTQQRKCRKSQCMDPPCSQPSQDEPICSQPLLADYDMFVSLAATPEAFLRQVETWAKETASSEMQFTYAESKQTTVLKSSVDWKDLSAVNTVRALRRDYFLVSKRAMRRKGKEETKELSATEQSALRVLVKRAMYDHHGLKCIKVQTGGRPTTLMQVTNPSKDSVTARQVRNKREAVNTFAEWTCRGQVAMHTAFMEKLTKSVQVVATKLCYTLRNSTPHSKLLSPL